MNRVLVAVSCCIFFGLLMSPRTGAAEDFSAWLGNLRAEAKANGISGATIAAALHDLTPIPRVIELDRRQPEFTLTFETYLDRVVNANRIRIGKRQLRDHRLLLRKISKTYGVQPRFIVALWGIETDFGRITGGFPIIQALATLAHDGRRSAFFRKELMLALRIIDEGHIRLDAMTGSWAGAMGQNQFMPSSFVNFAVDHDGDGRKDIWGTLPDIFASIANYLSRSGWRDDQTWGRPVVLPDDFDPELTGRKIRKGLNNWQALGVRSADGSDLPTRNLPASIVTPERDSLDPAFVGYDNYRVILRWNRSDYFAVAVGTLSDKLR